MKPILITTHSLAIGALVAAARTVAEKETPHLIIAEAPRPDPAKLMIHCQKQFKTPFIALQSGYERANQNQPWYARFRKS